MCLVGWRTTVIFYSPEIPTVLLFIKDSLGNQLFYHTPGMDARMARIPENLYGPLPGKELLVETGPQWHLWPVRATVLWLKWT